MSLVLKKKTPYIFEEKNQLPKDNNNNNNICEGTLPSNPEICVRGDFCRHRHNERKCCLYELSCVINYMLRGPIKLFPPQYFTLHVLYIHQPPLPANRDYPLFRGPLKL